MKPIKIDAYIPTIMETVRKSLENVKACDTKMNLSWDISDLFKAAVKDLLKPRIDITSDALVKMISLVGSCSTELAWHCLIDRPETDHFIVTDLLMYPQEVNGTAVDSNDEKYPIWLNSIDDATFERMKGQGHSHVNMQSTPSAADTTFYQKLLTNIRDYYIFFIMNKRQEIWVNLYDVQNNLIYEEKDIVLSFVDSAGNDIDLWTAEQLDFIEKTPLGQKKIEIPTFNTQVERKNNDFEYTRSERVSYAGVPLTVYGTELPEIAWTPAERTAHQNRQRELQFEEYGSNGRYNGYFSGYRD